MYKKRKNNFVVSNKNCQAGGVTNFFLSTVKIEAH